jgi:antitoxin component of RelBE/YafQ-DinJ toxin-antitoxin module
LAKTDELLSSLWLTTAIAMFYQFIASEEALPFPVEIPNTTTQAAMDAANPGEIFELFRLFSGDKSAKKVRG